MDRTAHREQQPVYEAGRRRSSGFRPPPFQPPPVTASNMNKVRMKLFFHLYILHQDLDAFSIVYQYFFARHGKRMHTA